jgi:putative ABC transport system permease protein
VQGTFSTKPARSGWTKTARSPDGDAVAIVGIAAGVALLFSSQVASSSLLGSVAQLSRGIVGHATLQLLARDPHGMPDGTLARVRRIPGVRAAAPLLEVSANAVVPGGGESVELVGADASLSSLGGTLVHDTRLAPVGGIGAVDLPSSVANTIGVRAFGQEATFQAAGLSTRAPLYAQLRRAQIGALAASPIAVAPLSFAQEIAVQPGRMSRILVRPAAGHEANVRAALTRIAGDRLNVGGRRLRRTAFLPGGGG